tara:strand:+ start:115 stop:633 length:519 start_codon:yes stop_codon:yes gene_type:complete
MDQNVLNSLRDESERKYFYCDTCNSLLPPPGYFCAQCEPPCGPDLNVENELTFSQAILRIILLTLLFMVVAKFQLDINIWDGPTFGQQETKLIIAEDEDFKLFYRINTGLANVRSLPNSKTSEIIATLPMDTQVEILHEMHRGWSKVRYKKEPGDKYKTGWIATKLLSSEIK